MFLFAKLSHKNILTDCLLASSCFVVSTGLGFTDYLFIANLPFAIFSFDLLFTGFKIYADLLA
jgi:hypothetical protein